MKPAQARPSHKDNATGREWRDGEKLVTKLGAMVIQDTFSLEIAPDTENL
ncbi:hypothetical protein [Burkholderia ubonensis]|nr:hypothetical protein [Burkholderia ubonensis]